jgi:hypothetical protein
MTARRVQERISAFQELFDAFVETVPQQEITLREQVRDLQEQLSTLLRKLRRPSQDAAVTAGLVGDWDRWCERFEKLPDDSYEKQLLELYISMPA